MIAASLALATTLILGVGAFRCPSGIEFAAADKKNEYYYCSGKDAEAELRQCPSGQIYSKRYSTCIPGSLRSKRSISEGDKLEVLHMPAISGSSYRLGALYDSRTNTFPTGSMYTIAQVKEHVQTIPKLYSNVNVYAENNVFDRAAHLNIEASLKLGFLSGLINVEGTAKYLSDQKDNNKIARVTMSYDSTIKAETMPLIKFPDGPQKLFCRNAGKENGPTHVVTSRVIGARAYLIFDRQTADYENTEEIAGSLSVSIEAIPGFTIKGSAYIDIKGKTVKNQENVKLKYYGDINLKTIPTSYLEAIEAFNQVKEEAPKANTVVSYELTPIQFFCEAAPFLDPAETGIVDRTTEKFLELEEVSRYLNNLRRSEPAQKIPKISESLVEFQRELDIFENKFKEKIATALPKLQSGSGSREIMEALTEFEASSFNKVTATSFLDNRKKEIDTIQLVLNIAKAPKYAAADSSGRQIDCVFKNRFLLEYDLKVLPKDLLEKTKKFIKEGKVDMDTGSWYNSFPKVGTAGRRLRNMDTFVQANFGKVYTNTCFLVRITEIDDGSGPFLSVSYKEGRSGTSSEKVNVVSADFEAPSSPPKPTCKSMYNGFKLSTSYTSNQNVDKFSFTMVEKKEMKKGDNVQALTASFIKDNVKNNNAIEFTLEDSVNLKPYTPYEIKSKYAVRSDFEYEDEHGVKINPGYSPDSEVTECFTAPSTPLTNFAVSEVKPDSLKVSFGPPSDIVAGVTSNYKILINPKGGIPEDEIVVEMSSPVPSGKLIGSLKPGTAYVITAFLEAPKSRSLPSEQVIATPLKNIPPPEVLSLAPTEASFVFKRSLLNLPSILVPTKVIFKYREDGSSVLKQSEVTLTKGDTKDVSVTLKGLKSGSKYQLFVHLEYKSEGYNGVLTSTSKIITFAAPLGGSAAQKMKTKITEVTKDSESKLNGVKGSLTAEADKVAKLKAELENYSVKALDKIKAAFQEKANKLGSVVGGVASSTCIEEGRTYYFSSGGSTVSASSLQQCAGAASLSSYKTIVFDERTDKCTRYSSVTPVRVHNVFASTLNKICYVAMSKSASDWNRCIQANKASSSAVIATKNGFDNVYDCSALCWKTPGCMAVSFASGSRSCRTHRGSGVTSQAGSYMVSMSCLM